MWNIKFIGIDISKQTLDIYDENSSKHNKIKNTEKEIKKYFKSVSQTTLIVYEPTWVYGKKVEKVLNDLNKSHYQIHANDAHLLGKTLVWKNKTDKLDCKMLVQIAKVMYSNCKEQGGKNKFIKPNSNELNKIQTLLTSIRFMKSEIKKFKQQLEYCNMTPYSTKQQEKMFHKLIKELETNIRSLEQKIVDIYDSAGLLEKYQNIQSIPWIWRVTAMELVNFFLFLVNKWFERWHKKQVVAYAGIHPVAIESGSSLNSSKLSKGWKREIKSALFMVGMQRQKQYKYEKYTDTTLWKFTKRMIEKFRNEKNKRGKSVSCAVWKKLLVTAWALFRDDTQYNFT